MMMVCNRLSIKLNSILFTCFKMSQGEIQASSLNRVRTLIRDPLTSLFDLMNTCILNTYISELKAPIVLYNGMTSLDCVFHLEFY